MKQPSVVLICTVVRSATAQVITTFKSDRKADRPPLPSSNRDTLFWEAFSPCAALTTILAPLAFVLGCEAAGIPQLGYTRSLVLFLMPVTAGAVWLAGNRHRRSTVQWRALVHTVGSWTCIGWFLDPLRG